MPLHLLLPLFAAILFSFSSMLLKRAFENGADTMRVFHHANMINGVVFSTPLILVPSQISWGLVYQPAVVALTIFAGALFTFAAIRLGDVSLVTPLLGVKVVVVAIAAVILTGKILSAQLWTAAILAALGIFVLGYRDMKTGGKIGVPMGLAVLSGTSFGVSDVLLQKWAPGFGAIPFLAVVSWSVAIFSVTQMLIQRRNFPRFSSQARMWVWSSNLLLSLQAMMMALALVFFNDAIRVNIVYGSRGVWGIVLVGALGSFLGLKESRAPGATAKLLWRLGGAVLVSAAIVLAVSDS
jgi:drug/metabolite transporter (DMT)-like permease